MKMILKKNYFREEEVTVEEDGEEVVRIENVKRMAGSELDIDPESPEFKHVMKNGIADLDYSELDQDGEDGED